MHSMFTPHRSIEFAVTAKVRRARRSTRAPTVVEGVEHVSRERLDDGGRGEVRLELFDARRADDDGVENDDDDDTSLSSVS